MSGRIANMKAFWPHYLSEHRDATSRRLHFVGTTGFFAACAGSAVLNPIGFPAAMAGFAACGYWGAKTEGRRAAYLPALGMMVLPTIASPVLFPAGVTFAYGCAWAGHFRFEHNRPATFKYPVWSFLSDLKMWGHMAQGKLWSGDPLEELGLDAPAAPEAAPEAA